MFKFFFLIFLLLVVSFFIHPVFSECSKQDWNSTGANIGTALNNCLEGSSLVAVSDAEVGGGFQEQINNWVQSLGTILGILAVGSIVYGGLLMTLSAGEDEKIKKAKDVVKWGMIGFVGVISASAIIILVVNIMFAL